LPKLFRIGSYQVYFWSDEKNEPIHVHVGIGNPSSNATKIWITSTSGCIVANNNGRISEHDLNELLKVISVQYFLICDAWKKHFHVTEIKYFA